MATISIDVPNTAAARVADAFLASYPPPAGTDVSTAAAKLAYVKTRLIAHVKDVVRSYESAQAGVAASKTAADKADAEVVPT